MPFSPETQQIIAEVERLSGRPIHVEEDAGLKTLAQVTPARGASHAHFVRYQPGPSHVEQHPHMVVPSHDAYGSSPQAPRALLPEFKC